MWYHVITRKYCYTFSSCTPTIMIQWKQTALSKTIHYTSIHHRKWTAGTRKSAWKWKKGTKLQVQTQQTQWFFLLASSSYIKIIKWFLVFPGKKWLNPTYFPHPKNGARPRWVTLASILLASPRTSACCHGTERCVVGRTSSFGTWEFVWTPSYRNLKPLRFCRVWFLNLWNW